VKKKWRSSGGMAFVMTASALNDIHEKWRQRRTVSAGWRRLARRPAAQPGVNGGDCQPCNHQ